MAKKKKNERGINRGERGEVETEGRELERPQEDKTEGDRGIKGNGLWSGSGPDECQAWARSALGQGQVLQGVCGVGRRGRGEVKETLRELGRE